MDDKKEIKKDVKTPKFMLKPVRDGKIIKIRYNEKIAKEKGWKTE